MANWNSVITEALNELQADTTFTRGAILRDKVNQISRRDGLDFDNFLKETNQKFSSVVEHVEDIEIHKRPDTDMYVGLKGAKWPEPTEERSRWNLSRFREDVYEAFTRIGESDYWYLPDTDEFRQDVAKDDSRRKIAIPPVTLEGLLNRRRFAEKVDAHATRAIERSPKRGGLQQRGDLVAVCRLDRRAAEDNQYWMGQAPCFLTPMSLEQDVKSKGSRDDSRIGLWKMSY